MNLPAISELSFGWRDALDIALVTFLFYNISAMVRQTRAVAAIYGLISLIAVYFISNSLGLYTLSWLLENLLSSLLLLVIIVFQRDIRHGLTSIGSQHWWLVRFFRRKNDNRHLEIIAEAATYMAERRIGALIVIERNVPLEDTTERGVRLDACISKELLINLFWHNSPLHDGAALIRGDRIVAGGCILPLSTAITTRDYGTRHRAALGITEESDAVVVVVSEERGVVSIAIDGRITGALNEQKLTRVLVSAMEKK